MIEKPFKAIFLALAIFLNSVHLYSQILNFNNSRWSSEGFQFPVETFSNEHPNKWCDELRNEEGRFALYFSKPLSFHIRYFIKKKSDQIYEVYIPLKIKNLNDKNASNFREKISTCLSEADEYLYSRDGIQFHLRPVFDISKKSPESKKGAEQLVNQPIGSYEIDGSPYNYANGALSDAFHWDPDASCGTLLHESLHLLGLVDERPDGCCSQRQIGPSSSGMYKGSKLKSGKYFRRSCSCDLQDPHATECLSSLRREPLAGLTQKCPAGTKQYDRIIDRSNFGDTYFVKTYNEVGEFLNKINTDYLDFQGGVLVLLKGKILPENPPLEPAHARMILYPGCKEKNKKYFRAAATAYKMNFLFLFFGKERPYNQYYSTDDPDWLR
jgi:hypothetical protein